MNSNATKGETHSGRELGTLHVKIGGEAHAIATHTLLQYHDGFSFGVITEVDALRAAYLYRHSHRVQIENGPSGWRIAVYHR